MSSAAVSPLLSMLKEWDVIILLPTTTTDVATNDDDIDKTAAVEGWRRCGGVNSTGGDVVVSGQTGETNVGNDMSLR